MKPYFLLIVLALALSSCQNSNEEKASEYTRFFAANEQLGVDIPTGWKVETSKDNLLPILTFFDTTVTEDSRVTYIVSFDDKSPTEINNQYVSQMDSLFSANGLQKIQTKLTEEDESTTYFYHGIQNIPDLNQDYEVLLRIINRKGVNGSLAVTITAREGVYDKKARAVSQRIIESISVQ